MQDALAPQQVLPMVVPKAYIIVEVFGGRYRPEGLLGIEHRLFLSGYRGYDGA
jgi:hypothetical protein